MVDIHQRIVRQPILRMLERPRLENIPQTTHVDVAAWVRGIRRVSVEFCTYTSVSTESYNRSKQAIRDAGGKDGETAMVVGNVHCDVAPLEVDARVLPGEERIGGIY